MAGLGCWLSLPCLCRDAVSRAKITRKVMRGHRAPVICRSHSTRRDSFTPPAPQSGRKKGPGREMKEPFMGVSTMLRFEWLCGNQWLYNKAHWLSDGNFHKGKSCWWKWRGFCVCASCAARGFSACKMRDNRGAGHKPELPVLSSWKWRKSIKGNESDRLSNWKAFYILALGHSHGLHHGAKSV